MSMHHSYNPLQFDVYLLHLKIQKKYQRRTRTRTRTRIAVGGGVGDGDVVMKKEEGEMKRMTKKTSHVRKVLFTKRLDFWLKERERKKKQ